MQPTYDSTPPAGASPLAESRFDCFSQRLDTQLATNTVPAFSYMVASNDHTVGTTPGKRTPQAMVADNDYGSARSSTRSATPRSGARRRSS